ncbi:MAG: hypothetical protein JXR41_10770 [Bacteroidales bacterium]|nr:hypothetical protein [Bacteroidales bacterium]
MTETVSDILPKMNRYFCLIAIEPRSKKQEQRSKNKEDYKLCDFQPNSLLDQKTRRPEDQQTSRPTDQQTIRPSDQKTRRPADQQTNRPADNHNNFPSVKQSFLIKTV